MSLSNRSPVPTTMTKPHRLMHSLLVTMGFDVEDEVKVGKYSLDCYIRQLHMGFECDGKRVHAGVKKQQKDRARDRWIMEHAGIPIMRIQADALQWQLWEQLKPLITDFIEEHTAEDYSWRVAKGQLLDV